MELIEMDSFTWEAYTEAAKHLQDVPSVPWEERELSSYAHQSLNPRLMLAESDSQRMRTCSLLVNYQIIDTVNNCLCRL